MKELYLQLKLQYDADSMFSSSHNYGHGSFKEIESHPNKLDFLPIILNELENDAGWFDLIVITYVTTSPKVVPPEIHGKFSKLKVFFISFLIKKIRELKLKKIERKNEII